MDQNATVSEAKKPRSDWLQGLWNLVGRGRFERPTNGLKGRRGTPGNGRPHSVSRAPGSRPVARNSGLLVKISHTALALSTATLTACGGGGSANPATTELRIELNAARQWSVPHDRTALVLPGQIQRVRLGHELREFGLAIDGDRLTLLCEGRVVDPTEGGIPAPAWLAVTLAN